MGALTGVLPPRSIISQVDAIANIWDILESLHLLAPPSLRPIRCPAPGCPRVPIQEAPRVASPPAPSLAPTLWPSPTWSLPPFPGSAFCLPLPALLTFQATPHRLNFSNALSQRVPSEPRQPVLPLPPSPVPSAREPISCRTRSRTQAFLALFAIGQMCHEQVKY